jgi:hypothetical protein
MNYDLQTIWIKAVVSLINVNSKIQTHGVSATPSYPVSQTSEGLWPNAHCLVRRKMFFAVSCFSVSSATDIVHAQSVVLTHNEGRTRNHTQTHMHTSTHTNTHVHTPARMHTHIHTINYGLWKRDFTVRRNVYGRRLSIYWVRHETYYERCCKQINLRRHITLLRKYYWNMVTFQSKDWHLWL